MSAASNTWISQGEKMPAQRAPRVCQLCQITHLFPPPMGEQGADPHHCGGVTAAPQSRRRKRNPPSFWFFPQRVHMPLPSASFRSSLGSAQLSRLQHALFSLQLVLFLTSSAPALSHTVTDTQIFKANTSHHFKSTTIAKQGWGKMPRWGRSQRCRHKHRLRFSASIKGPGLINPIATGITPEAALLLPSQGWAEPKERCSFPAC